MAQVQERLEADDLQQHLREVQELVRVKNLAELRASLDRTHAADIAFMLEALPP